MTYEIRRASASESGPWIIHKAGLPNWKVGTAWFKWTARLLARRWDRQDARSQRSYPA